jgi:hypothetical protein
VKEPIKKEDLKEYMSYFKTVIKAVVDTRRGIIALDAQLHADLERLLIDDGSFQEDLWGVNLYPFKDEDFIEYNALINIRPHQNNFSMEIENEELKEKIKKIIDKLIIK